MVAIQSLKMRQSGVVRNQMLEVVVHGPHLHFSLTFEPRPQGLV